MQFFSYDPQVGIKFYDTEESAMTDAEKAFKYERDYATLEGWMEEVDRICYGRVIGRVQVTETHIDEDCIERVEYGIVAV